jgi:NADP-dependent 3-hydroxy acid dehydrogenase YdfG
MKIGTCRISMAEHRTFADLSGDFNPLHLDPASARRMTFGQVAAYGMHSALKALEAYACWSGHDGSRGDWRRLTVSLVKPIFPDEDVDVDVSQVEGKVRIALRLRSTDLLKLILDRSLPGFEYPRIDLPAVPAGYDALSPRVHSPWDTEGLMGCMPVTPPAGCAAKLFPCCAEWLGEGTVAEMARLSAVVGMEWPGLHSLLARAVLDFSVTTPSAVKPIAGELSYRVVHADPQHAFTGIVIAAANFSARLEAFFRPEPVQRPAMAEIAGHVGQSTFRNHVVYVVGGSRGLGEVAVKLIAAGGGHPVLTYHSDYEAADAVAGEILAVGGRCTVIRVDVRNSAGEANPFDGAPPPTMVLFFATPKIFRRRMGEFDMTILNEFLNYYVEGFIRVVEKAMARAQGPLAVFYPSTVAIDEPAEELAEYMAAKAAGEAVCGYLSARNETLRIICERLPRLATDQTNSIVALPAADPIETVCNVLYRMDEALRC